MKKIISIILATLCICGAFAVASFAISEGINERFLPVNEDPAWAAKAIDANGQMKTPQFDESYSGVYFICHKTQKFYVADEEVCPHCGEKAYHYGKDNKMKTFQNSDLFKLKFAICCDDCGKCVLGNFDTVFESFCARNDPEVVRQFSPDTPNLAKELEFANKYKYLWTKGYDDSGRGKCPDCGSINLTDKWEVQWIYSDEKHYIYTDYYALDHERLNAFQGTEWKDETFDFSKSPESQGAGIDPNDRGEEDPTAGLSFWQKIILWFKNLFAAIAGLFS